MKVLGPRSGSGKECLPSRHRVIAAQRQALYCSMRCKSQNTYAAAGEPLREGTAHRAHGIPHRYTFFLTPKANTQRPLNSGLSGCLVSGRARLTGCGATFLVPPWC
ncbi:hypothetical protein E2C01_087751 [Portunus trituberculatus]|uniref:Uncharacterized protein n=1 Tax=Portunus trituberculatus TaxID=210409 RepID=A0A5B7J7G7_PORTR|nr:hypothetical protein [Portunus trituberculatus]